MNSKIECSICCDDYYINKNNIILDDEKKETVMKMIICPKCGLTVCSECMINNFISKKNFKCIGKKDDKQCENEYDLLYIFNNFNQNQIKKLSQTLINKFLSNEKKEIELTLKIKYNILQYLNKFFEIIFNACDQNLILQVGEIVDDINQIRYKNCKDKKSVNQLQKKDKLLINQLKKELKDRLNLIFSEYLTYYINGEREKINGENISLYEEKIPFLYDLYPSLKLYLSTTELTMSFRSFYTFAKNFITKENKYGVIPLVEVFIYIITLYEKVDNVNNKYINYLKFFQEEDYKGYEVLNQYNVIERWMKENNIYHIAKYDTLFRRFEIIPNYKNEWSNFNILKLLFNIIDISSVNISSLLQRQKYMSCDKCDGDCFLYLNQIRCAKCNSIFCQKCHAEVFPKFNKSPSSQDIIENPIYDSYTEKQKKHICLEKDLQTVKLIFEGAKRCPICNELICKSIGCDDMYCLNCWLHNKETLFKWNTMQLTTITTNEDFNKLKKEKGEQQRRYDHPDAQRFRARGATIEDILKEFYASNSKFTMTINKILNFPNINYIEDKLIEERIKYMFNLTNEDITLSEFFEFKPEPKSNLFYSFYEITPEPTTPKTIISKEYLDVIDMNINDKKKLIESRFKKFIYDEYINKTFTLKYSSLINDLKENIQDIIYTIKEDTYNKKEKQPLSSYTDKIRNFICSYNDNINILKKSCPSMNFTSFDLIF